MNATIKLSDIVEMYCTDYKQLMDDRTPEIQARYQSYRSLLKVYPIQTVNTLVTAMRIEIETLRFETLQPLENLRDKLFETFEIINKHKYYSKIKDLPNGDMSEEDEILSSAFVQADMILNHVAAAVNKLMNELKPKKTKKRSDLSAFEIALRHVFLEEAKEEPTLQGKQIVERYGIKKVEVFINEIRTGLNYRRKGLLNQLVNVQNSLSEFPEIQRSITNHIDKVN